MSDETATETATEAATEEPAEFEPITSQDDFDKRLAKRLERERGKYADYDDLKAKASEFDKIAEANKSELEKLQERAALLEQERDTERMSALRLRVAAKHGITDEDAELFLTGSDEESLTRQAERLAARSEAKPRSPRPNPAQGGGEATASGDWLRDQFANRK